nr:hypothetical protein [Helicobacter bilis]
MSSQKDNILKSFSREGSYNVRLRMCNYVSIGL